MSPKWKIDPRWNLALLQSQKQIYVWQSPPRIQRTTKGGSEGSFYKVERKFVFHFSVVSCGSTSGVVLVQYKNKYKSVCIVWDHTSFDNSVWPSSSIHYPQKTNCIIQQRKKLTKAKLSNDNIFCLQQSKAEMVTSVTSHSPAAESPGHREGSMICGHKDQIKLEHEPDLFIQFFIGILLLRATWSRL